MHTQFKYANLKARYYLGFLAMESEDTLECAGLEGLRWMQPNADMFNSRLL
jgi:hypothetical protein